MAQLFYAGEPIADRGAANLVWGRRLLLNDAGVGYGFAVTVDVGEAQIACAGPADAADKMAALQSILDTPNGDLAFDGGRVARSVDTLGGIRCVAGPTWLNRPGGNGITFVTYSCTFAWQYRIAGGPILLAFEEVVSVAGGAPTRVGFTPVNADLAIVQTTTLATLYEATQSGRLVGTASRVPPPDPIWPLAEASPRVVANRSGRRVGAARVDFETEWSYRFLSAIPLDSIPNEWLS